MSSETNLRILLQDMKPKLNKGEFVFCIADSQQAAAVPNPLSIFQETEGTTVIILKQQADEAAIPYSTVCAWITLTVHSSIEAVGLTAAVSKTLTEANISCNVVAAYHHDHIFVPVKDAKQAMTVLTNLSAEWE